MSQRWYHRGLDGQCGLWSIVLAKSVKVSDITRHRDGQRGSSKGYPKGHEEYIVKNGQVFSRCGT